LVYTWHLAGVLKPYVVFVFILQTACGVCHTHTHTHTHTNTHTHTHTHTQAVRRRGGSALITLPIFIMKRKDFYRNRKPRRKSSGKQSLDESGNNFLLIYIQLTHSV